MIRIEHKLLNFFCETDINIFIYITHISQTNDKRLTFPNNINTIHQEFKIKEINR